MQLKRAENAGPAPRGPMAGRWLDLRWAPGFLCVPLIMETASGARDSSPETLEHIQFAARGVNQTAMADVST